MGICSRCGGYIEFRYIDGRCVPMHQGGSCEATDASGLESCEDYSGYRASKEGQCYSTECPKCSNEVFFIREPLKIASHVGWVKPRQRRTQQNHTVRRVSLRSTLPTFELLEVPIRHNGGSVWIDPPLGPPWYKHSCFEDSRLKTERSTLFTGTSATVEQINENSILGIVKSAEVSHTNESTVIIFETGKNEQYILLMRYNAGYLVGKLALYRQSERTVTVFYEPKYSFAVVTEIHSENKEFAINEKVICPELDCRVELKNNIPSHLMNEHLYAKIFDLHNSTRRAD